MISGIKNISNWFPSSAKFCLDNITALWYTTNQLQRGYVLSNSDAISLLYDTMKKSKNVEDKMLALDTLCPGLGDLYLQYMLQQHDPISFTGKATDMIVANSTKLGRVLW